MHRVMKTVMGRGCLVALLLVVLAPAFATTPIPDQELAALQKAATAARGAKPGSPEQRRACKRVVRSGKSLVTAHPDAPNRFELLGLMLQNQKVVLKLESNDRNRGVLYDICDQLADAPDQWAGVRLEADLLLSERDLSASGASTEQRAQALVALIERYRGTSAEPKSLMIAAVIAQDLDSRELSRLIELMMDERCASNPEVIVFRRNVLSLKSLSVKCVGSYERSDGAMLNIPGDRMGHQCLLVYWSQQNPASAKFMAQVKAQQEQFPGAFEVYSFNLDELPDAGEGALRDMGLDWHAMHLPDGKRNVYYQAYGAANPVALFVNAFGYTVLNPFGSNPDAHVGVMGVDGGVFRISESRLSHARYLAQLQSLFIGDFLVTAGASPAGTNRAGDACQAIQDCFVAPPFRYRLTSVEALANYRKAAELCRAVLAESPAGVDLSAVRNRRIIALLGIWNLTCDLEAFEQACTEAGTALTSGGAEGAQVVPRFCLAMQTLRAEESDVSAVLAALAGPDAPASAVAAASVLALYANRRELHETYRSRLLEAPDGVDPTLWPVAALLRDRYHRFYLLRPNSTRGDRMRGTRGHIVNHYGEVNREQLPEISLKALDGSEICLPREENDKLTLLLFVEPPAEKGSGFPVWKDRSGKPTRNDYIRGVVDSAEMLAETHVNKDVEVMLAFLCDDAARVSSLMATNGWSAQAAMVPGGLKNPLVNQLGIFSADRVPNIFLLRRNGSVAWRMSGIHYKSEFGYPFAVLLGMKVHIEASEVEYAYKALAAGDYRLAARTFAGPYLPANPDRYGWRAPRHHGLALAQIGLKDWEAALETIGVAIDAHKHRHYRYQGRGPKSAKDWRPGMAAIEITTSCDVFSELWRLKAMVLRELGRESEAKAIQRRADEEFTADGPSLYGDLHNRLKQIAPKTE